MMGRKRGASFSSKKKQRSNELRFAETQAESLPEDPAINPEVEEPPLAQPARKKSRGEPTRHSTRGEPEKLKPKPRGPALEKSKRRPIDELSPDSKERRREKNRAYAKTSYKKRKQVDVEALPLDHGVSAYATTKTGKPRKNKRSERNAKVRDTVDVQITQPLCRGAFATSYINHPWPFERLWRAPCARWAGQASRAQKIGLRAVLRQPSASG